MPTPSLEIYLNIKTNNFIIQNYAVDKRYGFSSGWGKLIQVSQDEMRTNGINIILDNLREYNKRNYEDGCETSAWSSSKIAKFNKEHKMVSVSWEKKVFGQGTITLYPMERKEKGAHEGTGDSFSVKEKIPSEDFFLTTMEAFKKAVI